jgi:hypothetical protein
MAVMRSSIGPSTEALGSFITTPQIPHIPHGLSPEAAGKVERSRAVLAPRQPV